MTDPSAGLPSASEPAAAPGLGWPLPPEPVRARTGLGWPVEPAGTATAAHQGDS